MTTDSSIREQYLKLIGAGFLTFVPVFVWWRWWILCIKGQALKRNIAITFVTTLH